MTEPTLAQDDIPAYAFYLTDGVQTIFPYSFYLDASSDLQVYLGLAGLGILTTAYTLTGVRSPTGGNVIFYAAPPSGLTLFLRRATPKTQLVQYLPNDPFDAFAHASIVNKLTRLIQDQEERFSRIPQLPLTTGNAYRNRPLPAPVPVMLLGFDSTGGWTTYDPAIRQVIPDPASGLAYGKNSQTLLASSGVGTDTLTAPALFPAGVRGIGVTLRSTIPFGTANGLGTASLGDAAMINAWGSAINILAVTPLVDSQGRPYYVETTAGQWERDPFFKVPTALDVLLRADTGVFSSVGSCVVTAHFLAAIPD